MQQKPLLVVGIDPGITAGYAVLSINGEVIKVKSSKQLDINSLISEIHSLGRVLLVGVDKMNSPSLVDRFATKLGAKLVSPKTDMKVMEKNLLTRGLKFSNDHERDSLASALFAFREYAPLLKKIDKFVKTHGKEELADKITSLVVLKGIAIQEAADLLEEPEEEKAVKRIIEQKQYSEEDFLRIYDKLKSLRRDFSLLRGYNEKLKGEIERLKEEKRFILGVTNKADKKSEEKLEFKERRIQTYDSHMKLKDELIRILKDRIVLLSYFLANQGENYLVKKLDNLGYSEFELKNPLLNIQRGDILLVNDISVFSEKTISQLKNKVTTIIYKNNKADIPFLVVKSSELDIKEEENFALVNKKELDKRISSYELLKKIIQDYKCP